MIGESLLAAAAGSMLVAAHPFVTYPASLRLLAKWRARPLQPVVSSAPVSAAMCVCAYNEERVIAAKIENMLSLQAGMPNLELLVYVDGASDRTAEIVAGYGDRVRLVASPKRLGKSHGMNLLVGMTQAEFLVFSDANVTFDADALPRLLGAFADPEVGCVCGHLIYTSPDDTATAATGSLYWRLEEAIKRLESETGSVMGADGSIFALRRALHVPPPPDLIDDMFVSLQVLCGGHRVVRVGDAYAYEEAVSRPAEEFRRKVRIGCQSFNVHRALWPRLRLLPLVDRYKYVSHKLLRWLTVFFLAAAAICFAGGLGALLGWRFGVGMMAVYALGGLLVAMSTSGKLATLRDILGAFVSWRWSDEHACSPDRSVTVHVAL
jgi:cellulose synthase/poly-beta-1,6-N-acetylglucosamine synthase-like glycosyltransferase